MRYIDSPNKIQIIITLIKKEKLWKKKPNHLLNKDFKFN